MGVNPGAVRSITLDETTGVVRVELFNTRVELRIVSGIVGMYDPDFEPTRGPGRPAGAVDSEPRSRRTKAEMEADGGS